MSTRTTNPEGNSPSLWNILDRTLSARKGRIIAIVILFFAGLLGIYARLRGLHIVTSDMRAASFPWYQIIKSRGGFAALADTTFSNNTAPYLYILTLATYFPHLSPVVAIKIPCLVFDLVCALTVYWIVRVFQSRLISVLVAMLVFLLPTVWVNSAWWGETDSIFTAFLLLCILFVLKKQPWLAMVMYTIAFTFKLQSIFLAPLILLLFISKIFPWKTLLIVPVAFIGMMLPVLLLGQPLVNTISVYFTQIAYYDQLTLNAPNFFAFFPSRMTYLGILGFIITGVVVAIFLWWGWRKRHIITQKRIIELAMLSLLVVPFFLPRMHERYFYPAALFAFVLVIAHPRLIVIPFVLQVTTFLSYFPYLIGKQIVPLWFLAIINLVVIIVLVAYWLIRNNAPTDQKMIAFDSKQA
jgi:Gpi18-like mannosyltransferase